MNTRSGIVFVLYCYHYCPPAVAKGHACVSGCTWVRIPCSKKREEFTIKNRGPKRSFKRTILYIAIHYIFRFSLHLKQHKERIGKVPFNNFQDWKKLFSKQIKGTKEVDAKIWILELYIAFRKRTCFGCCGVPKPCFEEEIRKRKKERTYCTNLIDSCNMILRILHVVLSLQVAKNMSRMTTFMAQKGWYLFVRVHADFFVIILWYIPFLALAPFFIPVKFILAIFILICICNGIDIFSCRL